MRRSAVPPGWTAISPSRCRPADSRRYWGRWRRGRRIGAQRCASYDTSRPGFLDVAAGESVPDHDRIAAESVIDADLRDVNSLLDVRVETDKAGRVGEAKRAGAEVHVIVLGHHRPIVGESELYAAAGHPAPAALVGIEGRQQHVGRRDIVLVVCPRGAALGVDEGPIESNAQPARDGAERVDLGAAGGADRGGDAAGRGRGGADGITRQIGPAACHLDAEHPHADLVVAAELAAGEPSTDI